MECFICLESKDCTEKTKCCNQYAHESCILKYKINNSSKHFIKCPCCRKMVQNDIFKPLELYNLPISFYRPEFKFANESDSESNSENEDEYDSEKHNEYSFYVLKNKKTKNN